MANTLVIFASPNKNSFTMELLKSTDIKVNSVDFFDCFKASPIPCDGCGLCKKQKGCKYSDLDDFFARFEQSQNIIIAFPIYNGCFPAPLKSLLDRFQRFYNARFVRNERPPIKGMRDVTLVITAGSNNDPLPLITAMLKPVFTICGCKLKKAIMLLFYFTFTYSYYRSNTIL